MAKRKPGTLIIALIIGAAAGELTLSWILRRFPRIDTLIAVIVMYIAVKLAADLTCRITGRSVDEWGRPENYVAEVVNHWLTNAVLLAVVQTYFANRIFYRGTTPWRITICSAVAVLAYCVIRCKKEYELANAHILGRRARVKYGLD